MGWRKQRGAWWDMLWQITQRILLSLQGGGWEWNLNVQYIDCMSSILLPLYENLWDKARKHRFYENLNKNLNKFPLCIWMSHVQNPLRFRSYGFPLGMTSRNLLDTSSASPEKELQLVLGKEMQRTSGNSCHGSVRTHEHANWTNCSRWA